MIAETGAVAGRQRRALDSTILDDAVARQDTVTQLIAQIRRVGREVPGAKDLIANASDAAEWLVDVEDGDEAPETIAVLVRDRYQRDRVVTGLAERDVSVRGVDREAVKPGEPVVMTIHRAKGTEFTRVLLFDSEWTTTGSSISPNGGQDQELASMRSLVYVAATRARDELAVIM